MGKFVISICRIVDHSGYALDDEEQYLEFVSDYGASNALPYFTSIISVAKFFNSADDAHKWWRKNVRYLQEHMDRYCDRNTLTIREEVTRYDIVRKL